jgi:Sec-independent protein secretion pathway component TatC
MYIARGVLGICGLSIITIQGKLADKFSKKNYELIMGLCLNVPYIFNALNSFITAAVQSQTDNMPLCFYIGSGFCMISLLFAFWIIIKFLNPAEEETVRSPTIQHHH